MFCMMFYTCSMVNAQDLPLVSPADSMKSVLGYLLPNTKGNVSANMNMEFYTSGAAYFTEGKLDRTAFELNRIRLEVLGSFWENFSYHFRQSFSKYGNPESLDNVSSNIEYALVSWNTSKNFKLTAGKQFFSLGGYEYYVSAIRVREYSEFNNHVPAYLTGIGGSLEITPNQELIVQILNNRNDSYDDTFLYGLPENINKTKVPIMTVLNWNGLFADNAIQLRYAAAWGQIAEKKSLYYLTAGNIYEKGPVLAYVDLMYSNEGLDSKNIISGMQGTSITNPVTAENVEYFAVIANVDFRIHSHWNVYVKGAYETAGVNKAHGIFEKGLYRTSWNVQACAEYMPMRKTELKIFAHLLYKGNHLTRRAEAVGAELPNTQRISVGAVYVIPVF